MANELKHATAGTQLTQAEFEAVDLHTADSQAQGDILYCDGTYWLRLAAGTDGQFLKTQGAGANPTWADMATWSTWTPTVTQSSAQTITVGYAKYWRINTVMHVQAYITLNSTGQSTSPIVIGGLPASLNRSTDWECVGSVHVGDNSGMAYVGAVIGYSSQALRFTQNGAGNTWIGAAPSFGLEASDIISFQATYETT